jgi:membrane protease YdiL (CAAX protease family)
VIVAEKNGPSADSGLEYEVADRTGTGSLQLSFDDIQTRIRQGRLARSDRIAISGSWRTLGQVKAFDAVFSQVSPVDPRSLSSSPDLAGEGDTLALLEVFARLHREQRTGRFFVFDGESGHERVIALRAGTPIAAFSNVPDEWLGEQLLRKGLIDQADFERAVARRAKTGEPLGAVLLALECVTPRQLQMTVSVQALERLLNIFRAGEGTRFRFTPDPTAADETVMISAHPREIIETAIASALSATEVRAVLEGYTDAPIDVQGAAKLQDGLSAGDESIIAILRKGMTLKEGLPRIATAARLTEDEARVRLLALATYGAIALGGRQTRELTAQLASLQRKSYFDVLEVRMGADADALKAAHAARRAELGLDDPARQVGAAGRARQQIGSLLDQALNTLSRPFERAVYSRARQMGVDLEDPESRRLVELDEYLSVGHSALQTQDYSAAREAFSAASERAGDDPRPFVQLGWARFLESGHDARTAKTAIKEVRRALDLQEDFDVAWLYIGKIERMAGNKQGAEDALRKAITLNPNNVEAQSELRLIFQRELGRKGMSVDINLPVGMVAAVGAWLLATIALFFAANIISGGLTVWPDPGAHRQATVESAMKDTSDMVYVRLDHTEEELIAAAKELGAKFAGDKAEALEYLSKYKIEDVHEALAASRRVPPEQQRLGNAEYYHQSDDLFWWARRGGLLLLALICLLAARGRVDYEQGLVGEAGKWVVIAIPYGLVVGFMSGVLPTQTGLGMLVAMLLFHVIAEQLFFSAFVNRTLLANMERKAVAVAVGGLLFGLYHVSYFAILHQPAVEVLLDVLQIGAFAGGAYAFLLWRSGGLLAPFVAHLMVSGTLLIRSGLVGG